MGSRVFRSSNRTGEYKDGRREGKGSTRLANTKVCQEYVKNIQNFLELANYYHQFIKDFMSIARPLDDLVKKEQK